jgi:hypothetical protein
MLSLTGVSIEKLISFKDNFLSLSSTYANLLKETQKIKNKIYYLYKGFPDIVLTYLYQAQRTQNWDLYIDVLRHTRGEKGMTSNWYIEKLCTFTFAISTRNYKFNRKN